jgi:HD-like signal output (HDOD) protein/CheY-like chemotaxis protein
MASLKILVVEHNAKIGKLVASQLREKGFTAFTVRHGAEAAVALRKIPCDVVLLDNQIPLGGIKTARILRLHPKFGQIPLIISLPPEKQEARQIIIDGQKIGLKHFMLKPFTLAALIKNINSVVEDANPPAPPTNLEIREEIRNLSSLPAMPAAHSKLLTLLSKPDEEVDMKQVSTTLEQDPALSTKVMRTCRSAYFGFQGSMMKQAVAFLGVSIIRKIVQSAIIYDVFGDHEEIDGKLTMQRLWQHSLATGMAMEIIGKADKKKTHFLLGVLHDIGKAVFMFRFPDHFARVVELVEEENISILQAERELLGISHAECGGELAVHWDLPGEVRTAIASHHEPSKTPQHRRLAAMVHIADIAVRKMKIGYGGDDLIPQMDPYAKRLQKEVADIEQHREDFVEQVNTILGGNSDMSEEEETVK